MLIEFPCSICNQVEVRGFTGGVMAREQSSKYHNLGLDTFNFSDNVRHTAIYVWKWSINDNYLFQLHKMSLDILILVVLDINFSLVVFGIVKSILEFFQFRPSKFWSSDIPDLRFRKSDFNYEIFHSEYPHFWPLWWS